ncbi:erythromycin esterase family protein [Paenibacillus sp. DMB20]|uniref:erythromycin esterase family protein n=1 Tax=Paenibacillus sp. DMB20 TaxID=1642570 RepID=UPI00069B6D92|nr:erythromycin esterase family protein [Paenibacillus sp. DMB20]
MKKAVKALIMASAACVIGLSSGSSTAYMSESVREAAFGTIGTKQDIAGWKEWVSENAVTISTIKPRQEISSGKSEDRFQHFADLAFLKPLLQDKRIVSLGEASHGASEYNSVKVRLIQYLHEELGYNVLAFESNLGDTTAAYMKANHKKPHEVMKNSIFGVWQVEENLPLFEYIAERSKTERPLILTGVDAQGTSETFIDFAQKWFSTVDKSKAKAFAETEREYLRLHMIDNIEQFNREQPKIKRKYIDFQKFIKKNQLKLSQACKEHPELVPRMKRILQNRVDMLDSYIPKSVQFMAGKEPEKHLKQASYERDRIMADNLAWLARTLYPNEKIIVWGHNYHIRKHNSTMITEHNGFDFDNNPYPTMGEMIPFQLKKESYTIGLYAFQGSSSKNNGESETVALPHRAGSLEDILKAGKGPVTFIDMSRQEMNKGNSWMFTPLIAKAWGVLEEEMIPRDQYDGILFIDTIHPSKRIKK